MKYSGQSFNCQEGGSRITDAIITETRMAIDWVEDGYPASLVATSDNGLLYRGTYGYPTPEERYRIEFRLFKDQTGEVLLFGRWWRTDTANGGLWLLQLSAMA
jgi:hypothetical protein